MSPPPTVPTTGSSQPPPLPPEPVLPASTTSTHLVAAGETLESIAKDHAITPQELAAANGIGADADVEPHQTLALPNNARQGSGDSAAGLTPQQRTDAAYKNYQSAQRLVASDHSSPGARADQQQDRITLAQAKAAFGDAIEAEIATKVDQVNAGVPSQYRTPEAQLIKQFGSQIDARYEQDADARAVVNVAAGDYAIEARAENLIPGYAGNWTAADKLKGIDLTGQPQAVIDKVLADPRVQQWINDAAADVGKPYEGKSDQDILYKTDPAKKASGALYQTVDGLSAPLATAVVKASMPTIQKIAQLDMRQVGGGIPFKDVQDVISMLGDGQDVRAVVSQVAAAYVDSGNASQLADGSTVTEPALGVEIARQLSVIGGRSNELTAEGMIRSLEYAAQTRKSALDNDIEAYGEATEDLTWYVSNLAPSMTPEQKQAAIDGYMKSKGEEWRQEVDADKTRIVDDAKKLGGLLSALDHLPPEIASSTADGARATAKGMGDNEKTQQAIEFAASQDPTLFAGEGGESAAAFWVEVGHKSKDFTSAIAQSYVTGHVLPDLKSFNPNDPASVAKVRQVLEDMRGNAALLGVDKNVLGQGIDKLESLVDSLKTESLQDAIDGKGINAIGDVKKELGELGTLNAGPAGLLFRTVAFGLTGAALISAAGETVEHPDLQNVVNDVGLTLGFTQDSAALAAKVGLVDKSGSLGGWGLRTSPAGEAAERFVGALGVAYFLIGAGNAAIEKDVPGAAFNVAAAAGIGVATFVDTAWAGPVGWGVVLVSIIGLGWYEHVHKANKHEPDHDSSTIPFLQNAGFDADAARALADQSGDGYNILPTLVQFAQGNGYDMSDPTQQSAFVAWINAMKPESLAALRDQLHESLDDNDGDLRGTAIASAKADLGPGATRYSDDQLASIGMNMIIGNIEMKEGIAPLRQLAFVGGGSGGGEPA